MANARRGRKRTRSVNNNVELSAEEKKAKRMKISHESYKTKAGQVLSCGEGDTGQLGLGPDVMEKVKPGKVDLPPDMIQVCAGGMHSLCVSKQGTVYSWGCNDEGALGRVTEDEDEAMSPGEVDIPAKIVQVSAGDSHSAALSEDGRVFVFGIFRDANGKIGLTKTKETEPKPVEIMKDFVVMKIVSGGDHLVALTDSGDVYTIGCAEQGQLGRVAECFSQRGGRKGMDMLLQPSPVHFKKRNLKMCDIWTGQYVTYTRAKDTGEIFAWGLNNYFQLGFKDMTNRFVPEKVASFNPQSGWAEISGGQHHSVALDKKGKVYTLGRREYGRLGLGKNVEEKKEPTLVPALADKTCVSVNSGSAVSFAVTDKGEVYAWGMGTSKQLGQTDEEEDFWEPALVTGKQLNTRLGLQVAAGGQHTLILAQDKEDLPKDTLNTNSKSSLDDTLNDTLNKN